MVVGGGGGVGRGGCEQRIEVFVKIQTKLFFFWGGGGSGWGVRVDVNEVLKFWGKFTKKNFGEGGGKGFGFEGQGRCE